VREGNFPLQAVPCPTNNGFDVTNVRSEFDGLNTQYYMKRVSLFCFVVLLSGLRTYGQGTLEVTVDGIRKTEGTIWVGVFNNEDDFPEKATNGKIVDVKGNSVRVVFENLKAGDYALSIFHDANHNGKLDKNAVGIPKEGFGFGNNAMGTFGPPSFNKAKVTVGSSGVVKQVIHVKHM